VPDLAVQLQERLRESQRLLEGIRNHWLIRDYIREPGLGEPLPASRAPSGGGGR
jgi:hypothetical protein